ncbi:MAG: hypothetical protein LUD51_01940 [Clostridia bacterium]|nr:hypothetical protein [Clostridia bacterium]
MALNMNGLEGNERSAGDYTRKMVPEGRWSDTWQVFKSNFGKTVLINLVVLISFIPSIVIIFFRSYYLAWLYTADSVNHTMVYPFSPYTVGVEQNIVFYVDLVFYALLVISMLIFAVGISGAAYSFKKLINTHGDFTFKSFFHGVRTTYFHTLFPMLLFMVFVFGTVILGDYRAVMAAEGLKLGGITTAYVFVIIFTVLAGIYALWLIATGVSYKLSLKNLLKYSLFMVFGTPIQTIVMIAFAFIPLWLYLLSYLWSFMAVIMLIVYIFIGFTFTLISWMGFTQWGYDQFTNPQAEVEKAQAEAEKKAQEQALEDAKNPEIRRRELLAAGKSELLCRPIMPVNSAVKISTLGKEITRSGIARAQENRAALTSVIKDYEKEHSKDPAFVEYNKLFATREKVLDIRDKKGKKKKISSAHLLGSE